MNPMLKNRAGEIAPYLLKNQKGTALVLALALLAIMSILGVLALGTSTTEIAISGNFRASEEAFQAADRAVEYAMTSENIFTNIGAGVINLSDNDTSTTNLHEATIAAETGRSGLLDNAPNDVTFIRSGPLPPGSGSDPTYFQARYYAVSVTAGGPRNTTARVDSSMARIVPK